MNDKVKVKRERRFSAHHMLIREAKAAIAVAEAKEPGWSDRPGTAIILCAHAIEAICNAVGDRVVSDWKDFERISPKAKVRLLCEHLKIPYDKEQEPWSTVRWLLDRRNDIAHPQPQRVEKEQVWPRDEYDSRLGEEPLSKLEEVLTLDNAKRALNATEDMKTRFAEAVPLEDRSGLDHDAWMGSARAMNGQAKKPLT
jgi:hypothetical protein